MKKEAWIKRAAWVGREVLPHVIGWLDEGEDPHVRAIQRRAMRANQAGLIKSSAYSYIMHNTGDLIGWVALAAEQIDLHGILSYWISDTGEIHNANLNPQTGMSWNRETEKSRRGHQGWIKENAQQVANFLGTELSEGELSEEQTGKLAFELMNRGWIRQAAQVSMSKGMPNDAQFDAIKNLAPALQEQMGVADDFNWTLMNDEVGMVGASFSEVKSKGKEAFFPGEDEPVTQAAQVRTADTGGGMGGPFDQSDGFEKQPDFTDFINDGSPGWREKQLSYMPQDYTPEVWWGRSFLETMKQTFPGNKSVSPPESNVGPSTGGPTPFASALGDIRTADPVTTGPGQANPSAPASLGQDPAVPETGQPTVQETSTIQTPSTSGPTRSEKPIAGGEKSMFPTIEAPEINVFTSWDRVRFINATRLVDAAFDAEKKMADSNDGILWNPEIRIAVILNLKGIKWKEDYSDRSPKRDNFFRFVGKDKDDNTYVAHVIGDRPSEKGLYTTAIMQLGTSGHTRYDFESPKDAIEFVKKFWALKKPMKFDKLDAKDFIPKMWDTYMQSPRRELLRFILNSDAEGTAEFIQSKFKDESTPNDVKKAILDAYLDDPSLKGVPKALLDKMAVPILIKSLIEGDSNEARRLIGFPNIEAEILKLLEDQQTPREAKKALIEAILSDPKAKSSPSIDKIRDYIKEYAPQELEKAEIPELFEEQVTVMSRNPKDHKLMERAVQAWTDSKNKFTATLVELLQSKKATKKNVVKWLNQVSAYNRDIDELIPENPDLNTMQNLIGMMSSTLDVSRRFKGKKMQPFTHKVKVDYEEGGFFRVYLSQSDVLDPPVPQEVVNALFIHWKSEQPLAWAELYSFTLNSKETQPVTIWAVTELQSDIEQNADRILTQTSIEQRDSGNRWTGETPEDWSQYKSKIENWIKDWHKILFNLILKRASEYGVTQVWVVTSESLEERWSEFINKKTEPGADTALDLYRRVYDAQAANYGGVPLNREEIDIGSLPTKIRNTNFWVIDVSAIPSERFAMVRRAENDTDEDPIKEREEWGDTEWKPAILNYFSHFQRANKKITGAEAPIQEVMDFWYMGEVPESMKFNIEFLEQAIAWLKEAGLEVGLPESVRQSVAREEREGVEEYRDMVDALPEITEDTILDMHEKIREMPEGDEKERAHERMESMRLRLQGAMNGMLRKAMQVSAWGSVGQTFQDVFDAWKEGKKKKKGNYQTDGETLWMFGNEILKGNTSSFSISHAGWITLSTTSVLDSILNSLAPGWRIFRKGDEHMILYERPDGEWWNQGIKYEDIVSKGHDMSGSDWVPFMHGKPSDTGGMKSGSEVIQEISEEKKQRSRERYQENKGDISRRRYSRKRLMDLLKRAAEEQPLDSEEEDTILRLWEGLPEHTFSSWNQDTGQSETNKPEFDSIRDLAQEILNRMTPGGGDSWRTRNFSSHMVDQMERKVAPRPKQHHVEPLEEEGETGAMEGEEPLEAGGVLGRMTVADVTDPSDTDGQHDQLGGFDTHLTNPDGILYKKTKGRGAPYGGDGYGQGELKTSLPAAQRAVERFRRKA